MTTETVVGPELVQCEWCDELTTIDDAVVEDLPGARLTFCPDCGGD